MNNLKKKLYDKCISFVAKKLDTFNQIISANQNALQSESKSSAGDKHETGRAMLQLEMEKASQQYTVISQMNEVLQKITLQNKSEIAKLGTIIYTTKGNYFLAISIGEVLINDKIFYVISPSSPIGTLLLGKRVGEDFIFNGVKINIIDIV